MSGVMNVKFNLALAGDEGDVFVVLIAALEEDFVDEAPLHETIFIHVVHGFSPIEQ